MIISALKSLLHDKEFQLSEAYISYPVIQTKDDHTSKPKKDIMNKYHIMFGEKDAPAEYTKDVAR